jgi:signal transduction histidine kinase
MKRFLWKPGYKSWLTTWYIGFFTIVVIGLTLVLFLYIRNQTWDKFNYGVSQLGEEMLEELMELRDDLNPEDFNASALPKNLSSQLDLDDFSPVIWTPELMQQLKSGIEQEIVDESFDNQIADIGFVQISNLISGQLIYQSPESRELNIQFIQPRTKQLGYQSFEFKTSDVNTIKGLGYSGVRSTKHYFVGLIVDSDEPARTQEKLERARFIVYEISESIDRRADSLYVENKDELLDMIEGLGAWVYIYIYEEDRLLWVTKDIEKSDIYIPYYDAGPDIIAMPREMIPKEYFYDIYDQQGREYRQYTLIEDLIPTYIYIMDLAVPTDSIRQNLKLLALNFALGALFLIGIVWVGGSVLMRKALRPVDDVIRSVNEITSKNMDIRLPLPPLENEIMRLVMTFNELLDRLSGSFQMQKAFIADASHELRTPLSIIVSDVETALKNSEDGPLVNKSLKSTLIEIERMARIVDDLHLLAMTDSGQIKVNKKQVRLDDILMATISRCQILASKKKIKLNIIEIEVIESTGDEELLVRALSNVVYNAIKYSDENTDVELSLFSEDHSAVFAVSDHGIGISKEYHSKIFDRFYRIDSSRSRETGGSGLGLAISKWIIEMHHGLLTVRSKPKEGSTFSIKLPF